MVMRNIICLAELQLRQNRTTSADKGGESPVSGPSGPSITISPLLFQWIYSVESDQLLKTIH
jgi:hypothetical protein